MPGATTSTCGCPQRLIALLAALSAGTGFSIGCYCDDGSRCHRSLLKQLFAEHGATMD